MRNLLKTDIVATADHDARPSGKKSFADGFLLGLGSAGLFFVNGLPRPIAPKDGLETTWRAVGGYLRSAMQRHDG